MNNKDRGGTVCFINSKQTLRIKNNLGVNGILNTITISLMSEKEVILCMTREAIQSSQALIINRIAQTAI